MSTKNLWGDLPQAEKLRTPVGLLKEQASQLADLTNGVLRGNVRPHTSGYAPFEYAFEIVAPALDNYAFKILECWHDVTLYPARIVPTYGQMFDCKDEEEFLSNLERILHSSEVHRAIASLLAQSEQRRDVPF